MTRERFSNFSLLNMEKDLTNQSKTEVMIATEDRRIALIWIVTH